MVFLGYIDNYSKGKVRLDILRRFCFKIFLRSWWNVGLVWEVLDLIFKIGCRES